MLNKRASLELSIRAVVIVVLAMTLLGLGLAFVRSMFSDIGEIREDVTDQVRQNIVDDLRNNDKKISFPKTEVNLNKGDSEILAVGIRNKEDESLSYKMVFTPQSAPDDADLNALGSWFQYSQDAHPLLPSESDVRNIRLSVPKDAKSGSYFLTFDVMDANTSEIYAQKDFFIVVR